MRARLLVGAAVVVAALGATGWMRERAKVSRPGGGSKITSLVVTTTAKRQDLLLTVTQTGTVAAKKATPVVPEISGHVQWVCANGIVVKAGDIILRIDATSFQESLDNVTVRYQEALLRQGQSRSVQEARMKEMQLRLQSAQNNMAAFARQQEATLRQTRTAIDFDAKELAYRREEADATRRLAAKGLAPGTDVERQDAAVKATEFSVQRSRTDYELKQAQSSADTSSRRQNVNNTTRDMSRTRSFTERDVRESGNEVDNLTLQLQRAKDDLTKTTIAAPVGGLVVLAPQGESQGNTHLPRPGDFVSQGREMAELVSLARMQVKLELDQKQITGVRMGQPAEVTIQALPGTVLRGRVAAIGQTARRPPIQGWQGVSAAATFPVTVDLPLTGKILIRPGMLADVRLVSQRIEKAVVVPSSCIFRDGKQPVVFAVRDGAFVRVPVTLGAANGEYTQIVAGLEAGERIALNDLRASVAENTAAPAKDSAQPSLATERPR